MRKKITILLFIVSALSLSAQTLNVATNNVLYQFDANGLGEMAFSNATTLTIADKVFNLSDIDSIYVDNSSVTNNTISVVYAGTTASVTVAGNIASHITPSVSGANVAIMQDDDVATEITYNLTGSSTNGSFYHKGSYKITLALTDLTLTSSDSAAINLRNGKRIALSLSGTNTLADAKNGSQNACLSIKGHSEVTGDGTLTITGNTKHGIKCNEYMQLKKKFTGTITITSAAADGLHIGQYLEMNNGTITVLKSGDDGVQIEKTDDTTDEQNGQVIVNGGTMNITISAAAGKGLKSDDDMTINAGTFNIMTSGTGTTVNDTASACSCIKADGILTVNDGQFTLKSTGSGGKGMSSDSDIIINGGTFDITTTGSRYTASGSSSGGGWGGGGRPGGGSSSTASYKRSSPKGIKADGNITINGGTIKVSATGGEGSEGIESKNILTINDGTITVNSYDDCINSSSHLYVKGGTITVVATGNDGLDANGNLYIQGGYTIACGARSPECGIDANEEQKFTVIISGGTLLAIGGSNSVPSSSSGSTQPYVSASKSVSANNTITLSTSTSPATTLATFTVPSNYSSSSSSGSGWGSWGGSSSSSVLITCPGLTSGTAYTLGGSISGSVTAQTTSSSSGGRW